MGKGSVSSASVRQNQPEHEATRWRDRAEALRELIGDNTVVYAIRTTDGLIKIGCSGSLWNRRTYFGRKAEILGFQFGDFDVEAKVHRSLKAHVARGKEYYHPTPEVLAVVNAMRDNWNLPHLDA